MDRTATVEVQMSVVVINVQQEHNSLIVLAGNFKKKMTVQKLANFVEQSMQRMVLYLVENINALIHVMAMT